MYSFLITVDQSFTGPCYLLLPLYTLLGSLICDHTLGGIPSTKSSKSALIFQIWILKRPTWCNHSRTASCCFSFSAGFPSEEGSRGSDRENFCHEGPEKGTWTDPGCYLTFLALHTFHFLVCLCRHYIKPPFHSLSPAGKDSVQC